jgi:agmatine/peptidylarginine deiminase
MATAEASATSNNSTATQSNIEKALIVLAAPSVKNKYYSTKFKDIIDYMVNFANIVHGKDDVMILVDGDTLSYFEGKVPSNILVNAFIEDIWIRDFSSVIPSKQIKFKYAPNYLTKSDAKYIEKSFQDLFSKHGHGYTAKSDIILDGGNVVDNAAGTRVVITDRLLLDNPSLTKESAKEKLKELLGVKEVAIIPEPPNDTTGHSDGILTWPMDDKILIIKKPEPIHTATVNELKSSFPGVQIVELADYTVDTLWQRFNSAKNCFVNSIVTDGYLYMPIFNDGHDDEMLQLFKSHTNRTVVPIPSEHIAMMGGSARCLSWQVKNVNKEKILQLLKQ